MTDERFTPDEFARLLALPPDHPERLRAEADPRFDAWRRMLRTFESGDTRGLSAAEARHADAELGRRLERELGGERGAEPASGRERADAPRRVRGRRPALRLWNWELPAWAPAAAFAAMLVVAGGTWMLAARGPAERVMRGDQRARPGVALATRETPDGVELTWSMVPGADRYDVVFSGGDLTERLRVPGLTATTLLLRAGSPPAGLASGEEVAVEVVALRGRETLARSRTTALRLP